MSITSIRIDTWLQHLTFADPRLVGGWMADGVFYGNIGVLGDASAGTVTMIGQLSRDRKEDWVYVLQHWTANRNSILAVNWSVQFASGPQIPVVAGVQDNPVFGVSWAADQGGSAFGGTRLGGDQFKDLVLFGDKRIAGNYSMFTAASGTNTNGVAYQASVHGLLIRYNDFFRMAQVRIDARRLRGIR